MVSKLKVNTGSYGERETKFQSILRSFLSVWMVKLPCCVVLAWKIAIVLIQKGFGICDWSVGADFPGSIIPLSWILREKISLSLYL